MGRSGSVISSLGIHFFRKFLLNSKKKTLLQTKSFGFAPIRFWAWEKILNLKETLRNLQVFPYGLNIYIVHFSFSTRAISLFFICILHRISLFSATQRPTRWFTHFHLGMVAFYGGPASTGFGIQRQLFCFTTRSVFDGGQDHSHSRNSFPISKKHYFICRSYGSIYVQLPKKEKNTVIWMWQITTCTNCRTALHQLSVRFHPALVISCGSLWVGELSCLIQHLVWFLRLIHRSRLLWHFLSFHLHVDSWEMGKALQITGSPQATTGLLIVHSWNKADYVIFPTWVRADHRSLQKSGSEYCYEQPGSLQEFIL